MNYSITYQLQQEQRAGLFMTLELRQAIHLLQYSTMDLYTHVCQQLAENPVLEVSDQVNDTSPFAGEYNFPLLEQKKTLRQICRDQLCDYELDARSKYFCNYIIDSLDENGYLQIDETEFCRRSKITVEDWDKLVQVIQKMEPAGVGARSLGECIALQLRKKNAPPLAIAMAEGFLKEIAMGKHREISTSLGVPGTQIKKAIVLIRSCDPYPGARYFCEAPRYIYPDVMIRKINDTYSVQLNEAMLPRLIVNQNYRELVSEPRYKENIVNWYQSAEWLLRGIEQRRRTIVQIVHQITSRQRMFLEKGMEYFTPLALQEIALDLGIHESTVSRATQHKYVETPRGILPLRFFFSSRVRGMDEEEWSSAYIKYKMKQIVLDEDKAGPYSDQKITHLLRYEGIKLSRRTVSKYREELGILPSKLRKRG